MVANSKKVRRLADGTGESRPIEKSPATEHERQQLIASHLDVARNIARGLGRRFGWMLEADDIHGWAMVGLCEAATRFDSSRAEPFVAFAEQRIRGAVFDEIRRLGMHSRVITKLLQRISNARQALLQQGAESTDEHVATYLGITLEIVRAATRTFYVSEDCRRLESPGGSPHTYVECAEFLALLLRARDTLPDLEATVIRMHYDDGIALAQVARSLGLTLGRVRHLHGRGLSLIQEAMREDVAGGDSQVLRDSVPRPFLFDVDATRESKCRRAEGPAADAEPRALTRLRSRGTA
jgi:RNA polymerase sigma factor FliA